MLEIMGSDFYAGVGKRAQEYWEATGEVPDTLYVSSEIVKLILEDIQRPFLEIALLPRATFEASLVLRPDMKQCARAYLRVERKKNPQIGDIHTFTVTRREK